MNFIKSLAEKGFLLLLIFFFVYPITFWFMPITTRVAFGVCGGFVLLLRRRVSYSDIQVMYPAAFVLLTAIIAVVVNKTADFAYIFYCVSQLIIWLAALFLFSIKTVQKQDVYTLIKYVVYVVFVQSLLSAAISTMPDIKEKLLGLIITENEEFVEDFIGSRFVGWGVSFFQAGVLNGLGLICISFLLVRNSAWSPLISAVVYSIILGVGIMLARTTLIGCAISLMYMFSECHNVVSWQRIIRFFVWLVIIVSLLVLLAFAVLDEKIIDWAFEMFFNYVEYGSIETASTDRLHEMYIFPQQLSTYVFGDGLFNGPNGSYYMNTDVGYLRLLYYFGVLGTFAVFFWQYYVVNRISRASKNLRIFVFFIFMYSMVLNMKGVTDMFFVLFFLFFYQQKQVECEI